MTSQVIDPPPRLRENNVKAGHRGPSRNRRRRIMTTASNDKLVELVDRYIAIWNETDSEARRNLIAWTYTEDGRYLDPVLQGEGRDGIDAMVKAVHARFPGHRFTRTSDVDAHHDRARFAWELGPAGGPALVKGIDFATLSDDGKLHSVTGFFTQAPAAAQ
jgi:SnoaL-like domain